MPKYNDINHLVNDFKEEVHANFNVNNYITLEQLGNVFEYFINRSAHYNENYNAIPKAEITIPNSNNYDPTIAYATTMFSCNKKPESYNYANFTPKRINIENAIGMYDVNDLSEQITNYEIKKDLIDTDNFLDMVIEFHNAKKLGYKLPTKLDEKLHEVWLSQIDLYRTEKIGYNNLAFEISTETFDGELSKGYIDLAGKEALKMMARISLDLQLEKQNNCFVHFSDRSQKEELTGYVKASNIFVNEMPALATDLSKYLYKFTTEIENHNIIAEKIEIEQLEDVISL